MSKQAFVTKEQIEIIKKDIPTPFHLYSEAGIRKAAGDLNRAFGWNDGFKEYFAVKATPTPAILKILAEEHCGFDCASLVELLLCERCGFTGGDIMFSSNQTPDADFRKAAALGANINLDDFTHIDILEKLVGIPKTIFCRYNPGGEFVLQAGDNKGNVMGVPGEAKYGFTPEQIIASYKLLKEKGAETFGIHAFLSSNNRDNNYYPTLAGILFRFAVELREKTGIALSYINLSGGVGIPYLPGESAADIFAIGDGVRQAYENILTPAGLGGVKLCTELGRYMLAPNGVLVTTAIREKHIYKEYIGVDACAADLMRPAIYGAYHHITIAGKENLPDTNTYDIVGGLCENNDKFAVNRKLPKIDVGDTVIIHDAGAHGHSMGYNYNGKLRSAEVLLRTDGSHQLIRRAQTPEDYFATSIF